MDGGLYEVPAVDWDSGRWQFLKSGAVDMKHKERLALRESFSAHAMLANRLADALVGAAMAEQGVRGRGLLCVKSDSHSLAWTFKPLAECREEIKEWSALEGLLGNYDPESEVIVTLLDEGDFFRISL
jgi:hypothetical protein